MSIQGFEDWLNTPSGQYVLNWEQQKHDLLVADIFGFNAVQLSLSSHDFLRANRMPLRFRCDDGRYDGLSEVRSDLHYLPFAANSIDLVVLPHTLEFDANPHQVLREVERILVPEGHIIVTGFNPFSLWGVRRKLSRREARPPWRGAYLSVPRLKDWFSLLGFEMQAGAFGCYAPAVTQEKWLRRFKFMDAAGDRWWPIAGAVYVVQAVKRQHGMRLITPAWQDRKLRAKALVSITQKSGSMIEIFTDGACSGNPGPGGWGAILRKGDSEKELFGGEALTTNNRMEMMAVIEALRALKGPVAARVHTDSQYVQKGISEWIHGWKRRGWKTADRQPVKNEDLWREMDRLAAQHEIEWIWVKGHAGHVENERADELARRGVDLARNGG